MRRKINWNTIKIVAINWTIFVLLVSGFIHWLSTKELNRLGTELEACQTQWKELSRKMEEGEIVIELRKEDLKTE